MPNVSLNKIFPFLMFNVNDFGLTQIVQGVGYNTSVTGKNVTNPLSQLDGTSSI